MFYPILDGYTLVITFFLIVISSSLFHDHDQVEI